MYHSKEDPQCSPRAKVIVQQSLVTCCSNNHLRLTAQTRCMACCTAPSSTTDLWPRHNAELQHPVHSAMGSQVAGGHRCCCQGQLKGVVSACCAAGKTQQQQLVRVKGSRTGLAQVRSREWVQVSICRAERGLAGLHCCCKRAHTAAGVRSDRRSSVLSASLLSCLALQRA